MPELLMSDQVKDYLDALVPERPSEMQKMEAYAAEHDFPIIGPAAGYFCYQIARLIGARSVFELGSGYGYSTAWFAKAVKENGGGIVDHVVWDEELSQMAGHHLAALGYGDMIRYTVGEAIQALREAEGPFDLIFNDITKDAYPKSLPVIAEKLRPGGVLIIDNMLWSGRIFDDNNQSDNTNGVREATRMLTTDAGWVTTLVPIRDGLIIAYKK
ncbi:MAG: O-methyltransferase [Candidatus Promineifilaceae bacterium]